MYHENNFQSPIRTYPIIGLHEHWVIFHILEWYSTNQIPFCQSRLCSMTCHFLVNNLHFITYSNPSEKIHMEPNGTDSELFHAVLPCFDLTQSHVNSLYTICIFSCISHTEGKVLKGNNQSRSPLWNIILLSCSMYLEVHLFKIAIYLWWGFIGDTTKFQLAFCGKLGGTLIFGATNCGQIILSVSLLEEWQ